MSRHAAPEPQEAPRWAAGEPPGRAYFEPPPHQPPPEPPQDDPGEPTPAYGVPAQQRRSYPPPPPAYERPAALSGYVRRADMPVAPPAPAPPPALPPRRSTPPIPSAARARKPPKGAKRPPPVKEHRDGRLRLRVNPITCDGHGLCAELLPELLRLDEWGYPAPIVADVPPELEAHAQRAAQQCPTMAIVLERRRPRQDR